MIRAAPGRYRLTFTVLLLGVAIYSLTQSVVSPILPVLQHDLHTSQRSITWLVTGFLLASAISTPILGRVGDMYGKTRLFVVVLIVLALGCGVDAVAPNIYLMIFGRVLQGAGGAVLPLGFGIVRDELPHEKVAPAIGLIAALLGVGGGLGTVMAGPSIDLFGYHWLFGLMAIILLISAALGEWLIPKSSVRAPGRINWAGAALLSAWLVAILLAVSEAPTWGWASLPVLALLLGGAALFGGWIVVELRADVALIDVRMLRVPTIWRLNVLSFFYGITLFSTFAFLPQLAQAPKATGYGYGATVTASGLILLPSAGATFVAGVLAAPLARRVGRKTVLVFGSALGIPAFGLLALPVHHVSLLYISNALVGGSYGLASSTISTLMVQAVRADQTGVANGITTNFRTVGGAIGAAVLASVITASVLSSGYPTGSGYTHGWTVLAIVAAVTTGFAISVPRAQHRAGAAVVPAAIPLATGSLVQPSEGVN